jgi:endonuclease/exonuclease/phosphatase family metal-dependent hydrolase
MQNALIRIIFVLLPIVCQAASSSMPSEKPASGVENSMDRPHQGSLKVLSLNVAHGRKDALNQVFLKKADFENNLAVIAEMLVASDADIVALQEADGPSYWSGEFDHVAALAEDANYSWFERASHAQSLVFDYGTALLSRQPFEEVLNHTFEPSPPTMSKGLILGQIRWQSVGNPGKAQLVDVISVHLDFSRKKVRQQQIGEIVQALKERHHPAIILGDFNSDWFSEASIVKELAEKASLQVYRPEATDLGTYKDGSKRLDWILISEELEFLDYRVLPDVVSDHRAVFAEIGFRNEK